VSSDLLSVGVWTCFVAQHVRSFSCCRTAPGRGIEPFRPSYGCHMLRPLLMAMDLAVVTVEASVVVGLRR
jgi:hypothetical protein